MMASKCLRMRRTYDRFGAAQSYLLFVRKQASRLADEVCDEISGRGPSTSETGCLPASGSTTAPFAPEFNEPWVDQNNV